MNDEQNLQCGYVALLGRPNMGKSSLLNAMVGQKIAGVSTKPQTTRNRILGIRIHQETQILFLDTPGIHRTSKKVKLNSLMNREAWFVLNDADLVLYLVDCVKGWQDQDDEFLQNTLKASEAPVLIVLSKVDRMKNFLVKECAFKMEEQIQKAIAPLSEDDRKHLLRTKPFFFSAKDRQYCEALSQEIAEYMPKGPWLYPADDLTDRPQKFIIGELIREKVFRLLGEELPYQTAVQVEQVVMQPGIAQIAANIIVAKQSHKGIVIGKQGSKIKEIGTEAREALEYHLEQKVFLDLQVLVDEDWIEKEDLIAQYSSLDQRPDTEG